ncbi:hypothetical protein POTOM_024417 [Populus tomentosa]|uniref:Uncharacterized protein n=1 Tax=Populus tomentosa TaxID=118781 RepID=A0A8X8D0A0_POPTO|nr:hypothetical protein POTOM_024417 [Populus tomentosa]
MAMIRHSFDKDVLFEGNSSVKKIILNRPQKLNCINHHMVDRSFLPSTAGLVCQLVFWNQESRLSVPSLMAMIRHSFDKDVNQAHALSIFISLLPHFLAISNQKRFAAESNA